MRVFLIATIFLNTIFFLNAQDSTVSTQLIDVLNYYEKETGVSFSYDPEALALVFVDFSYQEKTIEEAMEIITNERAISYNRVSGDYYTIAFEKRNFELNLVDSSDSLILTNSDITVLVNGNVHSGGQSNENGGFSFNYKPHVGDSITIYVLGFEYINVALESLLNNNSLSLSVTPKTAYLDDLIVEDYLTKGINLNPVHQSITIAVENLPSLPGETDGDIFASLALLPGVSTPDNRPGNLFIRGSTTDQSLILFDNIPIYHKGHYFGTISPYNPKMVESVSVYRSGMHSRYGGRVGGAIEINSSTNLSNESKYGLGLNSLYGIGYLKTPLFNKKVGLALGGRRSFPVSFSSPKLDAISDMVYAGTGVATQDIDDLAVVYEDYNAKLEIPFKSGSELSLSGIYAGNATNFSVNSDDGINKQKNGFQNLGLNTQFLASIGKGIQSSTSFTMSKYHTYFRDGDDLKRQSLADLSDFKLNQEFDWGSKSSLAYSAGVSSDYQVTDYFFNGLLTLPNQQPTPVIHDENTSSFSVSPYVSALWNKVERLSVELGLRGTYYSELNDFALMPRVNASFDVNDNIILKGAFGNYRQYLSQIKYLEFSGSGFDNELWQLANDEVKIIHGNQSMLGFLLSNDRIVFDVELYNKTANNVTYSIEKRPASGINYDYADHSSKGVDVLLKTQIAESLDVWSGYSYSHLSITFDSAANKEYTSKYDQPHVFYLGGSLSLNNFNLSANWRFASGLYAFDIDIVKSEQTFLSGVLRAGLPENPNRPTPANPFEDYPERHDNIHSLDISASYKLPKKERRPFMTTFGLSILNTYNKTNLTDQAIRAGVGTPVSFLERNAMNFAPNLMMIVEW